MDLMAAQANPSAQRWLPLAAAVTATAGSVALLLARRRRLPGEEEEDEPASLLQTPSAAAAAAAAASMVVASQPAHEAEATPPALEPPPGRFVVEPPPGLRAVSVRVARQMARLDLKHKAKENCKGDAAPAPKTYRLPPRLWCCFYLRMVDARGFDLVPMIIGRKGCNTRGIAELTGAKIRVRGKGSGHLEMNSGREAPTPLMLVVAAEANNRLGFHLAVQKSAELLRSVEGRYIRHCHSHGLMPCEPAFTFGPLSDALYEELCMVMGDEAPPRAQDVGGAEGDPQPQAPPPPPTPPPPPPLPDYLAQHLEVPEVAPGGMYADPWAWQPTHSHGIW